MKTETITDYKGEQRTVRKISLKKSKDVEYDYEYENYQIRGSYDSDNKKVWDIFYKGEFDDRRYTLWMAKAIISEKVHGLIK